MLLFFCSIFGMLTKKMYIWTYFKDYLCKQNLYTMISFEEYDKIKVNEDEDLHLPTAAVVLVIVLSSLVGILIICEAIYGF